jgi:ABC-type lipoprotein release transport system permease subunit
MIVLEGAVEHEKSSRRASGVQIYGVDARFWQFNGHSELSGQMPGPRDALLSPALASEFAAERGDALLLRVQRPSDVPVESLHGRKDQIGRTIRLTMKAALPAAQLGEFSLRLQQGEVRAVFVPLERLQRDLGAEKQANTVLAAAAHAERAASDRSIEGLAAELKRAVSLDDSGLSVSALPAQRSVSLTSRHIVIPDAAAEMASKVGAAQGWQKQRLLTYLANTIRIGTREIPYSLVTAADDTVIAGLGVRSPSADPFPWRSWNPPTIWLNDWAARDLGAKPGDTVTLEYYVWQEGAGLRTESAEFELRGTVPVAVLNKDRALAPEFPGIADTESVSDWDPPFPVDLKRVGRRDEDYWRKYRTTPKALLRLEDGQRLWRSRYGQLTALRFVPPDRTDLQKAADEYRNALRAALDPSQVGFVTVAVRAQGLEASRGAINFGEYFIYFSFFIVVSAALLAGLFFRLGVEQRLREVGLLRAIGFDERRIARMFLLEGMALAVLGSALGIAGAIGYGKLLVYGLKTWWVGSVGTTLLELHVAPLTLGAGAAGGVVIALVVIALTLRGLRRATPVNLLAGARQYTASAQPVARRTSRARWIGVTSGVAGLAILAAAAAGAMNQVGGFFGAGSLLLTSLLFLSWAWLARERRALLAGSGAQGLSQLGLRNASWRPGRSLLCIALIASATFLIVAVDSFRRGGTDPLDPRSGTGGYPLLAESLLPIPYDLGTLQGRDSAGIDSADARIRRLDFVSFRLRPGDDASCLNLYQPKNPRILGAPLKFIQAGRFSFQTVLDLRSDQPGTPWELLDTRFPDGAVPAIADANSMTYVLHRSVGEDFVLEHVRDPQTGQPLRLRMVAALADSMFQSELIISEEQFLRLFAREPAAGGYRVFLIGAAQAQPQPAGETVGALEDALSVYGFDVVSTAERLASFHRVENTYLSTFQALGGLGLLLGTFGLAAVLLRNVLERRRELALLRAVGFRQRDLVVMIAAENLLLLVLGLVAGTLTALLAIAPALAERGTLPALSFVLLAGVLLAGLLASVLAVAAAVRAPLLEVLRSE